jgi:hypothetical protein
VKGQPPTEEELAKCEALASDTHAVALFVGVPHSQPGYVWCHDLTDSSGGEYFSDAVRWVTLADNTPGLVSLENGHRERTFYHDSCFSRPFPQLITLDHFAWGTGTDFTLVSAAIAATSARFEHGEQA